MDADLALTLGTQESVALEFKQSARDRNQLREAICGFANDLCGVGGGDLVIGVRKDGTAVDGVSVTDDALLNLAQIGDEGRILPKPSIVVSAALYQGKPVVRVRVNASSAPPVRFDGVAWVRPGPMTRRASRDDERVLAERRRGLERPFDVHPVSTATIADLDLDLFRHTYLPTAVDASVLEEHERSVELQLASLRLAEIDTTPTVLGLLVIGLDPTAYIPGAFLQFARFEGVDFDSSVLDEQEMRGNIVGVAVQLEAVLKGHLHTRLIESTGFQETGRPGYPLEALREVCMNALMHRNYESSYAPTRILWFADRIEVANPGGPFGQVRADNFDRVNDYRNPSLAAAMKALGYVNRFGRGIGRIRAALAHNESPPAEFVVDDSSWTVVIRSGS